MTRLHPTALTILARIMATPGHPPSTRELSEATGTALHSVHEQLHRLRSFGLVAWEPREPRTLRALCKFVPVDELTIAPSQEESHDGSVQLDQAESEGGGPGRDQ